MSPASVKHTSDEIMQGTFLYDRPVMKITNFNHLPIVATVATVATVILFDL